MEPPGFSHGEERQYVHCYTKHEAINFDQTEEKLLLATIEKEGKREEIVVKFMVSHLLKRIRRFECDNVYAPEAIVEQVATLFENEVFYQNRLKYVIDQYEVIRKIPED